MNVFAMAPPPSSEDCVYLAVIFGLFAYGCSFMAFRRLRSQHDPVVTAKWIAMVAAVGGMIAALAGPYSPIPDSMPHWIGYNAQGAILRAFFGAVFGIFVASFIIRRFGFADASIPRPSTFQFGISSLFFITTLAALLCAIFSLSAYVGGFVLLQLVVMVAAFAVHVQSALAQTPGETDNHDRSDQPESVVLVAKRTAQTNT